MIWTIFLFILVLSVLVFVHELGHFWTAKRMGMRVDEFGFGFPPRVFGVKVKETTYSLNMIPIGGFVKIKGESGDFAGDQDSFSSKKPWQRFVVLVAGVVMNLILAYILLVIGFASGFPSIIDDHVGENAHVRETQVVIQEVVDASPAQQAGITLGDTLLSIDRQVFARESDARTYVESHKGVPMEVVVRAMDGSFKTVSLTTQPLKDLSQEGIGVVFVTTGIVSYDIWDAIVKGALATWMYTGLILQLFGTLLSDLLIHQSLSSDVSGPVGIAVLTGQVADMGVAYFLQFVALLSLNLAVVNILPFPALDGGRIFFIVIEKLRGRAMTQKTEGLVHTAGFALLMALIIFVTIKDVFTLVTTS